MAQLDEGEEGKAVFDGDEIGTIVEVERGTAYVDPNPGLGEELLAKLGWGDADEDTYPIDSADVERVTDDAVHLGR